MKSAITLLLASLLLGCNDGRSVQIIQPALPDTRALLPEEIFNASLPAQIRFADSAPIDPLWAAFEGSLTLGFRPPELDGGPFVDLEFDSGLGELPSECMETSGSGPYGYDLTTGALTASADLGDMNTTDISFVGTLEKEFFYERLPDEVIIGGGEEITVIEYIVRSRTIGSGTWSFTSLDGACPMLPGPDNGTWTAERVDLLEGEGEGEDEDEGDVEELGVVGLGHMELIGRDGEALVELTTTVRVPLPSGDGR